MMPDHFVSSIRKDIYYFMALWIGQYTLEFLPFCIALELIYCQYLWELSCFEVDLVYDLCCGWRRHIVGFGNTFDAAAFFQLFIYLQIYGSVKNVGVVVILIYFRALFFLVLRLLYEHSKMCFCRI